MSLFSFLCYTSRRESQHALDSSRMYQTKKDDRRFPAGLRECSMFVSHLWYIWQPPAKTLNRWSQCCYSPSISLLFSHESQHALDSSRMYQTKKDDRRFPAGLRECSMFVSHLWYIWQPPAKTLNRWSQCCYSPSISLLFSHESQHALDSSRMYQTKKDDRRFPAGLRECSMFVSHLWYIWQPPAKTLNRWFRREFVHVPCSFRTYGTSGSPRRKP